MCQVYKDPATSKTFYYNADTQVSQWEPPPGVEGQAAIWGCDWGENDESQDVHEVTELNDLGV